LGWKDSGLRLSVDGNYRFRGRTTEVAEKEGFEPSVQFPVHTLSKRAP